jgi:Type II CAAX prenyl endopeptidase Rce1-like
VGKPTTATPATTGFFGRANLLTSLILVFPLFLLYQLGVALLPHVGNGADLVTDRLLALLGRNYFLLLNLGLALVFGVAVVLLRRRQQFTLRLFVGVAVESAIYALAMSFLVTYVISLLGIHPVAMAAAAQPDRGGPLTRTALAIGAGVNEELVFRLLLLPPTVLLFHKALRLARWLSVAAAFLVNAMLFSAAHHVIGGEAWALYPFVARLLFGLVFAAIYQWRGFAVAVYTHALYDFYVMVLRG